MKYTLEQLREENQGYAWGADGIKPADLEKVNRIIERIEQTRTEQPQELDGVQYTDEYGYYYPHAIIDGDTYHDGGCALCEQGSAYVSIDEQNIPRGSISGGAFPRIDINKLRYIGKQTKRFWTFSTLGAGANQGLYFSADVSLFELNNRADDMKEYTTEKYDLISVYDAGEDYKQYGQHYRYHVERGIDFFYNWKAFEARSDLDELLNRYEAKPEPTNNFCSNCYWILKEKEIFIYNKEEFDEIKAESETLEYFNGRQVPHKYVKQGTQLLKYVLRENG